MSNTPESSPKTYSVFVSFNYRGKDNGVEKTGFDSRVIEVPVGTQFLSAADLKEVTDALATAEFEANKRYAGLEITLVNLVKLPI